jgi:lipopolysaccharide export LptBFGC system permease protein LptF
MSLLPNLVDWFPIALIMSASLTIVSLSHTTEICIMQLGLFSLKRIVGSLMMTSFLILTPVYIMQLSFVPKWVLMMEDYRINALHPLKNNGSTSGFWIQDGKNIICVQKRVHAHLLKGIDLYTFGLNHEGRQSLLAVKHGEKAVFVDNHWVLYGVKQTAIQMNMKMPQAFKIDSDFSMKEILVLADPSVFNVLRVRLLEEQALFELDDTIMARYVFYDRLLFPVFLLGWMMVFLPHLVLRPRANLIVGFMRGICGILVYSLLDSGAMILSRKWEWSYLQYAFSLWGALVMYWMYAHLYKRRF